MNLRLEEILLCAYLCGAIPFGVIVGNLRGVDVRQVGSKNTGATNVWRALGPVAGTSVFLLDAFKGYIATFIGMRAMPHFLWGAALCALFVVLGHMFSVFLRFKGGKGIATAFGALICMVPLVALGCLVCWVLVLMASRRISVASIAACAVSPALLIAARAHGEYGAVVIVFAMAAILKHIPNMKRIIAGTEPKIGSVPSVSGATGAPPFSGGIESR